MTARRPPSILKASKPSPDDPLWREIEEDFARYRLKQLGTSAVYAIVALCVERPVKIGFSDAPTFRLKQLQDGNPFLLQLLGTRRGGKETEEKIHRYLATERLRGEWFNPSPRTLGVVEHLTENPGKVALLSWSAS